MSFVMDVLAYCDIRQIPNYLSRYLMRRDYPMVFDREHRAADRELFSLFNGWLEGTSKTYITTHMMTRSAHLIWKDLVENFLARTDNRQQVVKQQLSSLEFRDDSHKKETIPQYFARVRMLGLKYRAVGGEITERQIVSDANTGLRVHDYLRRPHQHIHDHPPGHRYAQPASVPAREGHHRPRHRQKEEAEKRHSSTRSS